jgi:hypothetical protein
MTKLAEKILKITNDLHDVLEMANAIKKYTGISGVIYFSTKYELKNLQAHSLGCVKLVKDDKIVFCSIKKDKHGNYITGGSDSRLIKKLVAFVSLNEDILWDYWNTKPEKADSAQTIQLFKKVE